MRIVVLGAAGKMAKAIIAYLVKESDVNEIVLADQNLEAIEVIKSKLNDRRITAKFADVNDHSSMLAVLQDSDAVVNTTIYYGNLKVMKACVESKTDYVDLGGLYHMAIKQLEFHNDFEKAGITGIVGAGSAPGTVNVMAKYAIEKLDEVQTIRITNASSSGRKASSPLAATYALDSVLDEFTMNAIVFEDGQFKEIPPYSFNASTDVEFPEPIGKGTSYPTIHTEVYTLANSYKDKGLKNVSFNLVLPEVFRERIHFLVSLGFGSKNTLKIGSQEVSPRDVLLSMVSSFPGEYEEPDDFKTNRVSVIGVRRNKPVEYVVEMYCHGNKKYGLNTTALATGVGGAIVGRMLGSGSIKKKGFYPIEKCVEPVPYFKELNKWGMLLHSTVKEPVP